MPKSIYLYRHGRDLAKTHLIITLKHLDNVQFLRIWRLQVGTEKSRKT